VFAFRSIAYSSSVLLLPIAARKKRTIKSHNEWHLFVLFVHIVQVMTDSLSSCISCTFSHMLRALGNHFGWCQLPQQSPFCWNPTSHFSCAAAAGLSLSHVCNCYLCLMQLAAPQDESHAAGSQRRQTFQYHIHRNNNHVHENSGTAGSKKRQATQPSRYAIGFRIARVRKEQSDLLLYGVYGGWFCF